MKFKYENAGPSGRGEGSTRYYVYMAGGATKYIGTLVGSRGAWQNEDDLFDKTRRATAPKYTTRQAVAEALLLRGEAS